MARRRRKDTSDNLAEAAICFLVALVLFLYLLGPAFRAKMTSFAISAFLILSVFGIIALIAYLVKNNNKKEVFTNIDIIPPSRNTASGQDNSYREGPRFDTSFTKRQDQSPALSEEELAANKAAYEAQYSRKWDVSILQEIEWKRFETVCTEFLRITGFEAKETNIGADGGVDIRVCKPGIENSDGIVQCKAWNTYKVGVKPMKELFGVMAAERVTTGIFMTSGDFTSEAINFAKGKITLIWGDRFIEAIRKLSEDKRKHLLDIALAGDYKTPTCPQCDIKMSVRESSKGRNAGNKFWGCRNYPRCRQTLVFKEA